MEGKKGQPRNLYRAKKKIITKDGKINIFSDINLHYKEC